MKILAATVIILTTSVAMVHADDDDHLCGYVPIANWMSKEELRAKIAPLDINVRDIDIDDGCYEVEVFNKNGREVEISFHPQSGEQVKVDTD